MTLLGVFLSHSISDKLFYNFLMTVKLSLTVSTVTQFASNISALRNFWCCGCGNDTSSIPLGESRKWDGWFSKQKRESVWNHYCFKYLSLNIGTLSQAFIWLMKSQAAGDIYPAKWWWLRRKRLYPAFFPPLRLLYKGSTQMSAQKELPVCEQASPALVLLRLLLMTVITLCSPEYSAF